MLCIDCCKNPGLRGQKNFQNHCTDICSDNKIGMYMYQPNDSVALGIEGLVDTFPSPLMSYTCREKI